MNKTVGIIGLGYVGLPLAIAFAQAGYKVIGFDVDAQKPKKLKEGVSYLKHISDDEITFLNKQGFEGTTDFSRLKEVTLISICVPTPLDHCQVPDLSYVTSTAEVISQNIQKNQIVVLESTTYPGTTREVVLPILEKSGLKGGTDFHLAFSPEREDPGREDFKGGNMPRVIGGLTPVCLEKACSFYDDAFTEMFKVSTPEVAEMAKLLENIYRCINIALVNELKMVADKMNINIWEVIQAASSKPFGFKAFYPGPGLGGHCIPIDPFYLSYKAKEFDVTPRFIEHAGVVNTNVPYWVVDKTMDGLNQQKKAMNGSKVLILGVAYKKDIDDLRESPAFKIWEILEKKGASVDYHDDFIPTLPKTREYDYKKSSLPLDEKMLRQYDAVMIVTAHSDVDYAWVCENSALVIDTRNATESVKDRSNIILA